MINFVKNKIKSLFPNSEILWKDMQSRRFYTQPCAAQDLEDFLTYYS